MKTAGNNAPEPEGSPVPREAPLLLQSARRRPGTGRHFHSRKILSMLEKLFTTADNYTAAFLIVRRVAYRGSFLSEDRKNVQFRFVDSRELQDLLLDFVNGVEVPARDFAEAHRFVSGQARKTRNCGG